MTTLTAQATTGADAIRLALAREKAKRRNGLKPIEIVKLAISAYQAHSFSQEIPHTGMPAVESSDRAGLHRGTQASVDRLLFNVNYWRAAYEDRIVEACTNAADTQAALQAISTWNSHTMKLNTLPAPEVQALFERFCPPPSTNNRRGNDPSNRGRGPIGNLRTYVTAQGKRADQRTATKLADILHDIEREAAAYQALAAESAGALEAFHVLLPVWCLQERIELVYGSWWDDCDAMLAIAEALRDRFAELGFDADACEYFYDTYGEAIDEYEREVSAAVSPFAEAPSPTCSPRSAGRASDIPISRPKAMGPTCRFG